MREFVRSIEWPTVFIIGGCYALWGLSITMVSQWTPVAGVVLCGVTIALHSSLQHEVIHGHPTSSQSVNEALVYPALSLVIPFIRFRDTHIAHHYDANLTDPFDDPESNFLTEANWCDRTVFCHAALRFNNTLLGRLLIGPLVAQIWFMAGDPREMRAGNRNVFP